MNLSVVAALQCPICRNSLTFGDGLRCPAGHNFDLARQGYADLTGGRIKHQGDTVEMVAARQGLLAAGHLDSVTAAVVAAVPGTAGGLALDAGGGTGHHLARLLDARPGLVGLVVDVAKPALRRAARAHPRLAAVRADVWRGLPVAAGSISLILNIFAPRSGAEFRRVLADDGALLVVTPNQDHLAELVEALDLLAVDPAKAERLATSLNPWFERVECHEYATTRSMSRSEAEAAVAMGPSAWHIDRNVLAERLAAIPEPLAVTVSIRLTTWRPAKRA